MPTEPPCFAVTRIHWSVILTRSGELLSVEPLYTAQRARDGRIAAYELGVASPEVPAVGARNGGATPGFLVDSLAWLFGYHRDGQRGRARAEQRYGLFRAQVLALGKAVADPGVSALCRYYARRPLPEEDLFLGFDEADEEPQPAQRACFAYVYQPGAPATPLHRVDAVVRYWRSLRAAPRTASDASARGPGRAAGRAAAGWSAAAAPDDPGAAAAGAPSPAPPARSAPGR